MTMSRRIFRRARRVARVMVGTDLYTRPQLRCPKLRLGNEGTSWCICPTGLSENSTVYSFGVGEDISFDLALIERFCLRVHAFDPTPRSGAWLAAQKRPEKFIFHAYGVGPQDGNIVFYPPENPNFVSYTMIKRGASSGEAVEAPVHRLSTIQGLLGHESIDLLKIDIEGSEYEVIADLIATRVKVGQLLVEFHHRWREIGVEKTKRAIETLNQAGFRVFDVSSDGSEYSFLAT